MNAVIIVGISKSPGVPQQPWPKEVRGRSLKFKTVTTITAPLNGVEPTGQVHHPTRCQIYMHSCTSRTSYSTAVHQLCVASNSHYSGPDQMPSELTRSQVSPLEQEAIPQPAAEQEEPVSTLGGLQGANYVSSWHRRVAEVALLKPRIMPPGHFDYYETRHPVHIEVGIFDDITKATSQHENTNKDGTCRHAWVMAWDMQRCDLCKATLSDERGSLERTLSGNTHAEDLSRVSSSGTAHREMLKRGGVRVDWLVARSTTQSSSKFSPI